MYIWGVLSYNAATKPHLSDHFVVTLLREASADGGEGRVDHHPLVVLQHLCGVCKLLVHTFDAVLPILVYQYLEVLDDVLGALLLVDREHEGFPGLTVASEIAISSPVVEPLLCLPPSDAVMVAIVI